MIFGAVCPYLSLGLSVREKILSQRSKTKEVPLSTAKITTGPSKKYELVRLCINDRAEMLDVLSC